MQVLLTNIHRGMANSRHFRDIFAITSYIAGGYSRIACKKSWNQSTVRDRNNRKFLAHDNFAIFSRRQLRNYCAKTAPRYVCGEISAIFVRKQLHNSYAETAPRYFHEGHNAFPNLFQRYYLKNVIATQT